MAVAANQFHAAAIWPEKIRLQMEVMIQPYSSRVDHAGTQRRKLRMLLVETTDRRGKVRLAVARAKLGVALGTRRIRRGLQKHCTLVLNMARGALGRECLIGVVQAQSRGF